MLSYGGSVISNFVKEIIIFCHVTYKMVENAEEKNISIMSNISKYYT